MGRYTSRHEQARVVPSNPLVYISAEGSRTEPEYFELLNDRLDFVRIELVRRTGGYEPFQVLSDLKAHVAQALGKRGLNRDDIAAVVIDHDNRATSAFDCLGPWLDQDARHAVALSRPKFELWLILHYQTAERIRGSSDLDAAMKRLVPGYTKGLRNTPFDLTGQLDAVKRSKQRLRPEDDLMPQLDMSTTVGLLVERISALEARMAERHASAQVRS